MKRLVLKNKDSVVNQIRGYLEKNSEAKFIHRLQVVLLFAEDEDKSCDSLGAMFGHSPRSISNWVKKVNQTDDIESLRSKIKSGRPSRLTESQKKTIQTVLRETPEKHGMQSKKWNGRILASYISKRYGIALNARSCLRIINNSK